MNRAFHNLLAGMNTLASVWVLFIVGLVSADVIGRAAFNSPTTQGCDSYELSARKLRRVVKATLPVASP